MRGQAAMEYLVTYGWAIAAVLVVIGGFSYFGLTQTDQYIPSSCTIGDGFSCEDFEVTSEGVNFLLSSTSRNSVFLEEAKVTIDDNTIACPLFEESGSEQPLLELKPSERIEIQCEGSIISNRVNAEVDLRYKVSQDEDAFTRRASGNIIGETQERALTEPEPPTCNDEEKQKQCKIVNAECGTITTDECGTIECPHTCQRNELCSNNQCVDSSCESNCDSDLFYAHCDGNTKVTCEEVEEGCYQKGYDTCGFDYVCEKTKAGPECVPSGSSEM